MPFLRVVKREHKCTLPTSLNGKRGGRGIGPGTIWECAQCLQQWIVEERPDGPINNVTGFHEMYWRRMDESEFINRDV